MNKVIYTLIVFAGILLIANCSPKTTKTSTTSNNETSNSTPEFKDMPLLKQLDLMNSYSVAQLADGQKIYESKCGKCHKLHNPDARTSERWMKIMKRMGPKAKLDNTQYTLVASYLHSKAKS